MDNEKCKVCIERQKELAMHGKGHCFIFKDNPAGDRCQYFDIREDEDGQSKRRKVAV